MKQLIIQGALYKWQGPSAWYFLPTTKAQGAELRKMQMGKKRLGFGSVRVRAVIGSTSFDTSIFPTKDGPYLLPIKASVRKKEGLVDKGPVTAHCSFI